VQQTGVGEPVMEDVKKVVRWVKGVIFDQKSKEGCSYLTTGD